MNRSGGSELREMQLRRKHSMKRAWEFAAARARGCSQVGRYFVLNTAPLEEERAGGHSLFGLVAPKRLGHAVVRNKLRRRVRELLRETGDPLAEGLYVVVILRQRAVDVEYADLRRDMEKLIARYARSKTDPTCSGKYSS